LLRRQWGAAVAFAAPLVLVKEDLPLTLAAIGIYLVWHGQRRLGWPIAVLGTALTAVLIKVVVPAINSDDRYLFSDKLTTPDLLEGIWPKLATLLLLFGSALFVGLRSRLAILLLPTLAWRFLSSYSHYWGPGYHYNAVLMPIAFLAAVDGFSRINGWRRTAAPVCSVLVALAVAVALFPGLPPKRSFHTDVDAVLARIPDGATVAAGSRLAPHLTSRCRVLFFPEQPDGTTRPDWIAVSKPLIPWPTPAADQEKQLTELERTNYRTVLDTDSVLLLQLK
jgi:uncharacterized membrane protein